MASRLARAFRSCSTSLEGLNVSKSSPRRKPWFHAPSGFWCAQVGGQRHYLDRDPVAAQRKLNKLLAERQHGTINNRDWLDAPFADLADEFLEDVKARKAKPTY